MSDAISLQPNISDSSVSPLSYRGKPVGTFPVNNLPAKEPSPDMAPKIGSEISRTRDLETQKKLLRDGELLAQAGITLKTDESGTVLTGMTLPETLLADELRHEAEEKGALIEKITRLEKDKQALVEAKKEADALIARLQKEVSVASSQVVKPGDTSAHIDASPSKILSVGTALRPVLPRSKDQGTERLARLVQKNTVAAAPESQKEPIQEEAALPQEISQLPVPEIKEPVEKSVTVAVVPPQKDPSAPNIPRALTPADPEQKKLASVDSIHTTLINIRGEDWKKYILPSTPVSTEQPALTLETIPWRNSFADQQFLEDMSALDAQTFITKHIPSDDQQFPEKILQASCFDIFNKETEKSLFGAPKGISVDAQEIDRRLEMRTLLGRVSELDEKAVSAVNVTVPPEADNVYSSPSLTVGDYILHVKTNVAKADNAAHI